MRRSIEQPNYAIERGETMAKLNITAAAKAVGIARGTFYRHIKDGKVKMEENHQGERVIDTSELLRVYGALKGNGTSQGDVQNPENEQYETPVGVQMLQQENEHLKQQVTELVQDKQERKQREKTLQAENTRLVSIIEKQTLLLPAPAEQPKKQGIFGWFSRRN